MGLGILSKSSYDKPTIVERIVEVFKPLPNPNPTRFKITAVRKIGTYLIALINYPDCKNYEGNKILIYQGLKIKELRAFKTIDPHFSNNIQYKSPIARFAPTKSGWRMAVRMCRMLMT